MATLPDASGLRILSLDGGGMKGYTSLLILKRILRAMKVEAKKEGIDLVDEPRPFDVFDLIVGTSTGGLIAIMLGRLHMTIDECIAQYEVLGQKVFGKKQWAGQPGQFAKGMFKLTFYDIDTLQAAIKSVLNLQGIDLQEDFKEDAPLCKTMVCVTRKGSNTAGLLRNYESEHSTQVNYKCTIWEAASATAAAPMFFKAVKFGAGGETWCDGGLHRNNPINVALAELQLETGWSEKPVGCVLSIGTGAPRIQGVSDNLAKFLKQSVDIMTDAEKIAEEFAMSKFGRELADTRQYFRFSVGQGMEDLKIDEFKDTERMKALTDRYLGKVGNGNEVERCAKSLLFPDQNRQNKPTEKPELLPYQNCIHFIDRESYKLELDRFFNPDIQGPRKFVLWGFGGSGKTQIALRFAHSMRKRLSVFWVRADNFANFLNDFCKIAVDKLESLKDQDQPNQDRESLARNVTIGLEKDPTSWLLVLDNADNHGLFVETSGGRNSISSYVPKTGRVLITTRNKLFQGTVTAAKDGLQVKPMATREARELFKKSITNDQADQSSTGIVDELLSLLGNLPLAVAQAAANIAYQQRAVPEYIAAYRKRKNRMPLMESPTLDLQTEDSRTSHQSILVTYEMTFEDLEQRYQESAHCLNYFGFFHWQRIPEACIRALPKFRDLDEQSFRNTIKHLLHLSMIEATWDPDGYEYSVHPVIHERISERLSLEAKMSYLNDSITVMSSMIPHYQRGRERECYAEGQNLQSHALLQIDLATDIGVKTEKLVLLTCLCAQFLVFSGMTSHSVRLATQAVVIGRDVLAHSNSSIMELYIFKLQCLSADGQHQEGLNESIAAIELLESAGLQNGAMSDQEYWMFRGGLLQFKFLFCRWLGKLKEAEETQKYITSLETQDVIFSTNVGLSWLHRSGVVENLLNQGRLQEARKAIIDLLDSMDEQQRTIHKQMFLHFRLQEARILRQMRDRSDAEPAVVLANEEEMAILLTFRDVFTEQRAAFMISHPDVWSSCAYLLDELCVKGEAREAAEVLVSILTEALESGLLLEGQVVQEFTRTLRSGVRVIRSLNRSVDARQGPPGLSIAELFVQIIVSASSTAKSRWDSRFLYACCFLFLILGNLQKAEYSLREAWRKAKLEGDRSSEGRMHYELMISIAIQGRIDDARRHRDTFVALIAPEETANGSIDDFLQQERREKELYDKAKDIITGQHQDVPESWWTENRVILNDLQLRYGLLVPKTAGSSSASFEGGSHSTGKDQKGKSRA